MNCCRLPLGLERGETEEADPVCVSKISMVYGDKGFVNAGPCCHSSGLRIINSDGFL